MRPLLLFCLAISAESTAFSLEIVGARQNADHQDSARLDVNAPDVLKLPRLSDGQPAAGRRVIVRAPEYRGTDVFHTVYLPTAWTRDGEKLPIIFEYTGNHFPASGSTGEPEDAGLGYGLSGGKYIWVALPYISQDRTDNAVTWWGNEQATIDYAKRNVPRIIDAYRADPNAVLLCGFSRGAIGVNYLGLHDDEIAGLWTAFVAHDHFDGVKAWRGTTWGAPLEKYRQGATERLRRVGNRPYLVSHNGHTYGTDDFVRSVLVQTDNFTFNFINAKEIFGEFPNPLAKSGHTDRWLLKPSKYRTRTWNWMNQATGR